MITDLQQILLNCFNFNLFLPWYLFFTQVLLISGPKVLTSSMYNEHADVGLVDQVVATVLVITPFVNRWYERKT